jgi:hypothetical protein
LQSGSAAEAARSVPTMIDARRGQVSSRPQVADVSLDPTAITHCPRRRTAAPVSISAAC